MVTKLFNQHLDAIRNFERHENISRLLGDLEIVFSHCHSFSDQELLIHVLLQEVDSLYIPLPEVLNFFWEKANQYESSYERSRSIMHMFWWLNDYLYSWLFPLPEKELQQNLLSYHNNPLQKFIADKEIEIWNKVEFEQEDVASAAVLLLGCQYKPDPDDLELLLNYRNAELSPCYIASALLALGRRWQYTNQFYKVESGIYKKIEEYFLHPNGFISAIAINQASLINRQLPSYVADCLAEAINHPEPIPDLWTKAGSYLSDYTSREIACLTLKYSTITSSRKLVDALNAVPEGKSKVLALSAIENLLKV